jgi:hypothetical protein
MISLQRIKEKVEALLGELHRGQGGAIAIMVLAALLIVFMISLVIYDTGKIARDKLEVQAAAETAAWSHTAIEARSMNTISFANVGKKIIIGMNAYYDALLKAYIALAVIVVIVIVACAIASIIGIGAACLQPAINFGKDLATIIANEGRDLGKFYGSGLKEFFNKDLEALDNYQTYMAQITPWWAWMEGYLRGARNGAMAVGTFPVPRNLTGSLLGGLNLGSIGLPAPSNKTDALPAKRSTSGSGGDRQVCDRLWSEGDILINAMDYTIKSVIANNGTYSAAIIFLTALIAMPLTQLSCRGFFGGRYNDKAYPFEIPNPGGAAGWQLATSNLVFAYRPNSMLKNVDKNKYNFIRSQYDASGPSNLNLSKNATGSWAMARAEIAFQDDEAPDLWHPNWSSRMRPIHLNGEWSSPNIGNAAMDVLPYLAVGTLLSKIVPAGGGGGGGSDFQQTFTDMLDDGARLIMSTDALKTRTSGLPR